MNPRDYFEQIGAWPAGARGVLRASILGFLISLLLTLAAYAVVVLHLFTPAEGVALLTVFAVAQFLVQLFCFLHLGRGRGSRERVIALCFAGVVAAILLAGSLWIMSNLAARTMPSAAQMEQYMDSQTGI